MTSFHRGCTFSPILPPQFAELGVLELVPHGRDGATRTFALRLSQPPWKDYQPGQFVMLRPASWGLELPWARPFSICSAGDHHLECFIQVVGHGTERMTALKPGDAVHVWGPLGNGFAVEADGPTLLLAGGIGIAPFVGYAQKHPKPEKLFLLFGHRAPLDWLPVAGIQKLIDVEAMHDAGPADLERFVAAVRARMEKYAARNGLALACGPLPFLRTVQKLAARTGLRTQLSLESRMACGAGAGLGCAARTTDAWPAPEQKNRPVQTCLCGPVFWADHVILE
ncbi:MAG: dihydroorotate dehydrogenase electron transfer subunit [Deltaproteobacteria bacterium]|nr:dihydroorotate dehydrogenase electron transfer subunit [Deltaproteobacteria bacterium]